MKKHINKLSEKECPKCHRNKVLTTLRLRDKKKVKECLNCGHQWEQKETNK